MSSAVCTPDLLSELVGCPRCHGPMPAGDGSCSACGTSCRQEGPVVNYLGQPGFLTADGSDVAKASWLLEHRQRWEGLPVGAAPATYGQLADGEITAADIERMISGSTFFQIMNDMRRIQEGIAPPSPTVQFMLAQSKIGPESVVLDVGCSAGRHLWELVPRSPRFMAGVDIQLFPLAVGALTWQTQDVPRQPTWCCASALSLPFKDGTFSHVHCFGTLSVVPIQAALAELKRVLAPGGQLMVTMEGMGYWRRNWDGARFFSRERLNLMRRWTAERLLRWGMDWQQYPLLRRLSGHNQFTRPTIERVVARAGLVIDECQVLNEYKNRPLLFGVTLHKREDHLPAGTAGVN